MKKTMEKKWKKRIAGGLAACVILGSLPVWAWAEEPQEIEGTAQGRYLETELELPEDVLACALTATEDGKLRILGQLYREPEELRITGFWDSDDGGATWELAAEFSEEYGEAYFAAAALAPDGGGAGLLMENTNESGEAASMEDYQMSFLAFDGQGNAEETELGTMADAEIPGYLSFHSNGTLTAVLYGGSAVLLDRETGAVTAKLCDNAEMTAPWGENVLVLTDDSELLLYNIESGEPLARDEALEEAFFADGNSYMRTSGSGYPVAFASDKDGRLYYCNNKGIYTHMPEGSAVEQVVDGSLNSLSDPSNVWIGMAVLGQTFYTHQISENGGFQLIKYEYDPDVPSVPERELTIYSLEENSGVRQAIIQFQKQYPDTYVNYQTGMSGEEGVTAADALRTLNTDILAGNGPDVLLLDGISVETYTEKGLLMDLSEILRSVEESDGLLENVAETYAREDGVFAVPAYFTIPVIEGKKEWVDTVQSLEDLNKLAEQQGVLEAGNARSMATLLYPVCAGSWRKEDGTIDQEKLTEYVAAMKQFYTAWTEHSTQEEQEAVTRYFIGWEAVAEKGYDNVSMGELDLAGGLCEVYAGELTGVMGYSGVSSINKATGDCTMALLQGQQSGVFVPHTILSILNTGKETERAKDFVTYLLSKEGQLTDQNSGFPVNAQAFQDVLYVPTFEDGEASAVSQNTDTGEFIDLYYSWPTKEELDALSELAGTLNARADEDYVVRHTVLEHTYRCLDGEISVEEAVSSIMQTVNLYLAE